MNWRPTLFLSGFTACLLLIVVDGRHIIMKAPMRGSSEENSRVPLVRKKKVFVQRLDASNFLAKQGIRFASASEEIDDETQALNVAYENHTGESRELDERFERDEDFYEYYGVF